MRHVLYPKGFAVYATDANIMRCAAPLFLGKTPAPSSNQREQFLISQDIATKDKELSTAIIGSPSLLEQIQIPNQTQTQTQSSQ